MVLDEFYVKACLQCHGAVIFWRAVNNSTKVAYIRLSFVVFCLAGTPKF